MEKIPQNFRYSKEHEWAADEDGVIKIGITDHAQCQLGDVVYIELPEEGKQIVKDKVFGVVESVKAVSDLMAPISGEVIAVNSALVDNPELVNESPHSSAWMVKVRPSNREELSELMDANQYTEYLKELSK